jgi:hypothetical protein
MNELQRGKISARRALGACCAVVAVITLAFFIHVGDLTMLMLATGTGNAAIELLFFPEQDMTEGERVLLRVALAASFVVLVVALVLSNVLYLQVLLIVGFTAMILRNISRIVVGPILESIKLLLGRFTRPR